MRIASFIALAVGVLALALPVAFLYMDRFVNPGVADELRAEPNGERAQKVMLLTLPSGREIPVNYLREGDWVYAGADGRWWRELTGDGGPVSVFVRGEALTGRARAVLDDPAHTKDVFARLRPAALPGFGTLVEVRLDAPEADPE